MSAILPDPLSAATDRRLAVRRRTDLFFVRQRSDGRIWWVVKDPVAGRYFRLREEEAAVLEMLDGQSSLGDICANLDRRFNPKTVTASQIQSFIGTLYRSGLVVADRPGQGPQLLERHLEQRRGQRLAAMFNLLAIRFRGIDPERFLDWLYPKLAWLFSRWCAALACVLVIAALLLITVEFDHFRSRLPRLDEFFQARNLIWMAAALGFSKVLHELGHALTCKHFGGECHELGLMLLVFTPCLYCNVSDAWILPSKWQRAAIASAGMAVEIVLAAIATFVWWLTAPGLLNYLCLSTMLICSVSTLLLNGNPLLRFDGYFILSNLLEIPNLAQKSRAVLIDELASRCLGLERRAQGLLPERHRGWFAIYAVSSTFYRWAVVLGILWFLSRLFKPYGLEIVGQAITLIVLCGFIGAPLWRMVRFFRVPGRMNQVKQARLAATLATITLLILAALYVPLPARVYASLVIEPRNAERVYVSAPGVLHEVRVRPGDRVKPAAVLAVLVDWQAALEVIELQGRCKEERLHLRSLTRRRVADPEAGAQIPAVQQALDVLEERLQRRLADQERLTLRATRVGTVLPTAIKPAPARLRGQLPSWSGTALDPSNLGCYLASETLVCLIGDPTRLQATLVINQSDVQRVRPGQELEIQIDALPGRVLSGRVNEVAKIDLDAVPRQLSSRHGGELQTEADSAGNERPQQTSYLARVPLDDPQRLLLPGHRGRAKIFVARMTLAEHLGRYLSRAFHFES